MPSTVTSEVTLVTLYALHPLLPISAPSRASYSCHSVHTYAPQEQGHLLPRHPGPVTLVTLFTLLLLRNKAIYCRAIQGQFAGVDVPLGEYPWRWSFCGWGMWTGTCPQTMVVPDAREDAR